MNSNLLQNRIYLLQNEYKVLLNRLLLKLKSVHAPEALDEINIFWFRHIEEVRLYLKYWFSGEDSFVFTAATFIDYDDKEHLPFLMIGNNHVIDDPLSKYSEIESKMPKGNDADFLYKQIGMTAEDNLKILENAESSILILPLRILNQSECNDYLYSIGEKFYLSLFDGIESIDDYFTKCKNINDIISFSRKDISEIILFSKDDDKSLSFEQRFRNAVETAPYMTDKLKPDSYNFFMLVYGFIQQAIDILISCIEYGCIPYIRYLVSFHYVSLISENMKDIEHIKILRYKMSIAYVIYLLCDKDKLSICETKRFIEINSEYKFSEKLFGVLFDKGINEKNFLNHSIMQIVLDELEKFYSVLLEKSIDE